MYLGADASKQEWRNGKSEKKKEKTGKVIITVDKEDPVILRTSWGIVFLGVSDLFLQRMGCWDSHPTYLTLTVYGLPRGMAPGCLPHGLPQLQRESGGFTISFWRKFQQCSNYQETCIPILLSPLRYHSLWPSSCCLSHKLLYSHVESFKPNCLISETLYGLFGTKLIFPK